MGKEYSCNAGNTRDAGSISGLGRSPGDGHPLEKATHSSILAWRTPWAEDPGGQRVHVVEKSQTLLNRLSSVSFCMKWTVIPDKFDCISYILCFFLLFLLSRFLDWWSFHYSLVLFYWFWSCTFYFDSFNSYPWIFHLPILQSEVNILSILSNSIRTTESNSTLIFHIISV